MNNKYIVLGMTSFILMFYSFSKIYSQASSANGTNNPVFTTDYLGWASGNNLSLLINNKDPYPINFLTNNIQYMTILGSTNPGFVGIGTSSPLFKLDLDNGYINIKNPYYGYCIGGGGSPLVHNEVLKYHGAAGYTPSTTNIFVGIGAGIVNQANIGLSTGLNNTFVGNDAGVVNTDGYSNTFIGYRAGFGNTLGRYNTLVGDQAGNSIQCRYFNTFVGYQAGFSAGNYSTPSSEPGGTFVGNVSGYNTINEIGNSFFGDHSGFNNETGTGNTYIGAYSMADYGANNSDNIYSTALGAHTRIKGNFSTTLGAFSRVEGDRSTAIGQHAFANHEDIIIIGDNYVNVGIGLSCDIINIAPPATTLELNAIIGNNFANIEDIPGASGLRFRDLTINSTPVLINPNTNVLSVNSDGDVILVPNYGFGLPCNSALPQWNLTHDWRVGLGDANTGYNLLFDGQFGNETSHVGIGYGCNDEIWSKLQVLQTKSYTTSFSNDRRSCAGVFISVPDIDCKFSIGVIGWAQKHATTSIGVAGVAVDNSAASNNIIGIYGTAIPNPIMPDPNDPLITKSWAGFFNGPVYSSVDFYPSDSIIKTGISSISKSLEIIDSLKPKIFYFDTTFSNNKGLSLSANRQYGF
jgi:hypothetical protein